MSVENIERISRQAQVLELEDINRGILELSKTLNEARFSTQPRILLELAIVKLCLGAGEIKELSDYEFEHKPAKAAKPAPKKQEAKPEAVAEPEPETVQETEPEIQPEEPDVEPVEAVVSPVANGEFDYEEIWNDVFEDGENTKGSFYIIRSGSTLTSIDENDFTVVVSSEITERHIENNRRLLEDLMEKHTGKRRIMKISTKDLKKKKEKTAEEIASDASDILGIQVDIT